MASQTYPLGKRGPIIGNPYQGTHKPGATTPPSWQSDNAIDIAVPAGTPVYAVAAGTIGPGVGPQAGGNRYTSGDRLTLKTASNAFWYGHLSSLVVKAGEHVTDGQLLGYSGKGNGVAHLHFAAQKGTPGDAVRGAIPPANAPAAPTAPPAASPAAFSDQGATLAPPALGTPPGATDPSTEMPGSAQHYLPGQSGVADSWQSIASLQNLSPDTQRLIALSSGG